ncbi:hypothetical protein BS47DRAFT_533515 [Hydnum rufescens UP504]|uniref:Uncharacterized protein n=1 Tax=Hydnum rufescens UP504 TaxID=1448309 RepID=A0A9P6B518_9AGAM|nr:hypothetical protein BS47DRAFT_533515 [Hydnum rufescens UP504]
MPDILERTRGFLTLLYRLEQPPLEQDLPYSSKSISSFAFSLHIFTQQFFLSPPRIMSPRVEQQPMSRVRVRVRANENKAPTTSSTSRTRRKRSAAAAGLPYSDQRHLYVRPGANRNHTGDRDPSESRSSSSHRRTSYITIVTGDEPSIPMEFDFSQGGIDRFMSSSSAAIDDVQFSWGGIDLPTGSEDLALPPELEPLSEEEMGPWATKFEDFFSKYVGSSDSQEQKNIAPEPCRSPSSLNGRLVSLLEANTSTLDIALDRLREALSACSPPESPLPLRSTRRAEKLPSTRDALERVQTTANEIIALVALIATDVPRLPQVR